MKKTILLAGVAATAVSAYALDAKAANRLSAFQVPTVSAESKATTAATGGGEGFAAVVDNIKLDTLAEGMTRRTAVLFKNGTASPVTVDNVTTPGDERVSADVISDDCSEAERIMPGDRCMVELEITALRQGPWELEVVLHHSGPGRLAKGLVSGTSEATDNSSLEKPTVPVIGLSEGRIDFGSLVTGRDEAAKTIMIHNKLDRRLAIDKMELVASSDDLKVREGGCTETGTIEAGARCAATVLWSPQESYNLSAEMLVWYDDPTPIVVPISGQSSTSGSSASGASATAAPQGGSQPPRPENLGQAAQDVADSANEQKSSSATASTSVSLKGVINNMAIIAVGDTSAAVTVGQSSTIGGTKITVNAIEDGTATIHADGKPKTLKMGR